MLTFSTSIFRTALTVDRPVNTAVETVPTTPTPVRRVGAFSVSRNFTLPTCWSKLVNIYSSQICGNGERTTFEPLYLFKARSSAVSLLRALIKTDLVSPGEKFRLTLYIDFLPFVLILAFPAIFFFASPVQRSRSAIVRR